MAMKPVGLQFGTLYRTDLPTNTLTDPQPGGLVDWAFRQAEAQDYRDGKPLSAEKPLAFCEQGSDFTASGKTPRKELDPDTKQPTDPGDVYIATGQDARIIRRFLDRRYSEMAFAPGKYPSTLVNIVGCYYLTMREGRKGFTVPSLWILGQPDQPKPIRKVPVPAPSKSWAWPKWPRISDLVQLVIEGCFPSSARRT